MKHWIFALCSVLFFACSEDNFPKYVELGDLRILALISNQPEVDPGTAVTLTPIVSDVNNAGALNYSYVACVVPGLSNGSDPTCDGNPTSTGVTTGAITTLNAGNTFTGPADSFNVTVPATILNFRSSADQYNGVAYLVIYSVTNSQGKTVQSFKRLLASTPTKTLKNSNPGITAVLSNGAAFANLPAGGKYELSVTFTGGSQETYSLQRTDGSFRTEVEDLQVTWFYSDGETKYYRTLNTTPNTYTAPGAYPGTRGSFLYLVVRDGRGGLAAVRATAN